MASGSETLDIAEDVDVVAALAAALSEDELSRGMVLAAISGQLRVSADVVRLMSMPVLATFLARKGRQLRGLAINEIGRAMATAAVADGMGDLRDRLASLGLDEVAQGMGEFDASSELSAASGAAAEAGAVQLVTGVTELAAAQSMGGVTRELAAQGVADVAAGSAEVGAGVGAEATLSASKRNSRKTGSKK